MTRFGLFESEVAAMQQALSGEPLDEVVTDLVHQLSRSAFSWPTSPVGAVNVLAGTIVASAIGMAGAASEDGFSIFNITDREDLSVAVESLRRSADVFEAMIKAGRQ